MTEVLVLNGCSFHCLCNEKGQEEHGRVKHDKENWQLFSHLITSVILYLPCHQQKNDPNHQNNHFLRFHYNSLLKYKLYTCPRHAGRLQPQNVPEDLHNVQIVLEVHHLSDIRVLLGIYERSVETHWVTSGKDLGSRAVHERLWKNVLSEFTPSKCIRKDDCRVSYYLSLQSVLIFLPNCTVCLMNCEQLPSPSLRKMLICQTACQEAKQKHKQTI